MLDFVKISTYIDYTKTLVIEPDFLVNGVHKDLMVKGQAFYAVWSEEKKIWVTDPTEVVRIVDDALREEANKHLNERVKVKYLNTFGSGKWTEFLKYVKSHPDRYKPLDEKIMFSDAVPKRSDYVSRKLPYSMAEGSITNYETIMSVIYSEEERRKLEWMIGCVLAGDSKKLQKFFVLYGDPGTGKSTFLNILQKLFEGYWVPFEAKTLANGSSFPMAQFKDNPLLAIQHDGKLNKIEDNTLLNSLISHETMMVDEKYKQPYSMRFNTLLVLGTNDPVKITNAQSGLLRRLIDVQPTGKRVSRKTYDACYSKIDFELGAIAYRCLQVYKEYGKTYYDDYRATYMMDDTNDFYNFVEEEYEHFIANDANGGTSLDVAFLAYKAYVQEANIPYPMSKRAFKAELKHYFATFYDRKRLNDGSNTRSVYEGFIIDKFKTKTEPADVLYSPPAIPEWLNLSSTSSKLDSEILDCQAQYSKEDGTPKVSWSRVKTKVLDIDTSKEHYVRVPENLICIDFDLKDSDGNKDRTKNLMAAGSLFPETYAEFSKSGNGLHLHYWYDGDVEKLSSVYDDNIEIKVFKGKSALRRRLSFCNDLPINHISSGLPLKEEKKKVAVNDQIIFNESGIITMLERQLVKGSHSSTIESIKYLKKILDTAYENGVEYDVTRYKRRVLQFAAMSTHHPAECIALTNKMHFRSEDKDILETYVSTNYEDESDLVFFDVEVFPNLFVIVWKMRGKQPIIMINPTAQEVMRLRKFKLVGFNNRNYDNHIIYAAMMGATNAELYDISQRIINNDRDAKNRNAYNLSYTDIYDFASAANKMSLKKFEIKLGIHHLELGLPWDKEVDEALWDKVAKYCVNDVIATEAVFDHLSGDWAARKALAKMTGLTYNDTTNQLTTRLMFGDNKNPQSEFVYTDLSEMFPGYKYDKFKRESTYRGEIVGEGGYVYAEPGVAYNVFVDDVASMHPHSIIALNLFGDRYTKRFRELVNGRLAVKHRDFETMEWILDGALKPYIGADDDLLSALTNALKTAINSVYGLTAAKFPNAFRDPRNIDNIVAKRGALFMINLKHEVQDRGFKVLHIKTDSIKIENPTPDILKFVEDYGKSYGYTFECEEIYERICLVNNAVYIAKEVSADEYRSRGIKPTKKAGKWVATGAQFAQPYIFKTLFSKEAIEFEDLCETKTVQSALYLDMNENLAEDDHDYVFIGKASSFCPIKDGRGGGVLVRENTNTGGYSAVTGTKGYRWLESETVRALSKQDDIDKSYYVAMVDEAVATIEKFVPFQEFIA